MMRSLIQPVLDLFVAPSMDPFQYKRQHSSGSSDGCFYEGNGNGQTSDPQVRDRTGSGSLSTDDEADRLQGAAGGSTPFR